MNDFSYDSPDEISTDRESRNSTKEKQNLKGAAKDHTSLSYDALKQMSKKFHKEAPPNLFFREKIPYRTIAAVRPFQD